MRIIIGVLLIMGLVACSDDVKQAEVMGEGSHNGIEAVKIKEAPVAVQAPKTMDASVKSLSEAGDGKKIDLTSREVSTQAVKKDDIQVVGLQNQASEKTQVLVAGLAAEKKAESVKKKISKADINALKTGVEKAEKNSNSAAAMDVVIAKKAEAIKAVKAESAPVKPEVPTMMGDVVKGKALAKRCSACHDFGMRDKAGPHLQGVFHRAAGQSGFKKHSKAFKSASWIWDETHLLAWVCDSKAAVKSFTSDPSAKTKMPNQKMCGEKAKHIVAYLKTL